MAIVIDCNLFKNWTKKNNGIITAWHPPAGDYRVIIPLDYSQSQTTCIVTGRPCASTTCAHKSTTLATVFCFSRFPPRHSRECHCKLTVWFFFIYFGTKGEGMGLAGHRGKPFGKYSFSLHFCPSQGESIGICAPGGRGGVRVIGRCCQTQVVDAHWVRRASWRHSHFPERTGSRSPSVMSGEGRAERGLLSHTCTQ